MTLEQSMDESLALSLWNGTPVGSLVGQRRSSKKEKQFARLIEFQLKLSLERGLPMSGVMLGLGLVNASSLHSSEPLAEVVTTREHLASICEAIPQGRCRVVLDTRVSFLKIIYLCIPKLNNELSLAGASE